MFTPPITGSTQSGKTRFAGLKEKIMDYQEWLRVGIENGFCTEPICQTHDVVPMHETEERAWDEGSDPCCLVVRLGSYDEWELPDWYFEG